MLFKVPASTNKVSDSSCTLNVTENGLTSNQLFTYLLALTPTLASVSPNRGGTGGGTVLKITGQNFPTNPSQVVVTIAGSVCDISAVTTTLIVCVTNSYLYSSIVAPVQVFISNNGFALDVKFEIKYFT